MRFCEKIMLAAGCMLRKLGLHFAPHIHYIGGSDTLPPPLAKSEEERLIAALADGEETAKKPLIEHNLRLVVYIARRFENTGINLEDLISIGTIGLIKAVSTFKADKNIRLATYACRCIENPLLTPRNLTRTSRAKMAVGGYFPAFPRTFS